MRAALKTFEFNHLIVLTDARTLHLPASKAALKSLVTAPDFDAISELLLDFRQVECEMSVTDIHELVTHMTWHIPVLFDDHRVAVLVKSPAAGNPDFNHAQFHDLCAENPDLHIRSYDDRERAAEWMRAALPNGPVGIARPVEPAQSSLGRRPQFGLA